MIGNSLSGISFAGLSSGIDTQSIVQRLIAIEGLPIQRMRAQQLQLQAKQTIYQQLRNNVTSLSAASAALNSATAFTPVSATSSKPEVATVSTGPNAAAGTYNLSISKLAQAHKVSSSAQASATGALSLAGTFIVNGKAINVVAADSLTAIAQKVNDAQTGATASVIDGGTGNAFLTLTAAKTGKDSKIQVADLTGTIASAIGLANGTEAVREPITNGATSAAFTSNTTVVGNMLGATGLGATSFTINGVTVNVNLGTQSLTEIASAINAAGTGATATVRSITVDSTTKYKLDIVGASTPTFVDSNGTLKALGVLQKGYGNQLVAAQDAAFALDSVALTSASNTVAGIIPDVTLTLLKANETTPETATLTISQDNGAVKEKIKQFQNAFNSIAGFIRANSKFDKDTFDSGPLFGDSFAQQIETGISDVLFQDVAGLSGAYSNLAELGFGLDSEGQLTLDEAALDAALAANPRVVGEVFRATGVATVDTLQFISATERTRSSGTGLYAVNITQLATKGAYTAETAQTLATVATETLTFSGALFGSENKTLIVPLGSTQTDIVNLINNDSKLKDLVVASVDAGKLKIQSKKFGAVGNFAVVSTLAAGVDNSGIGTSSAGVKVTGVDVAGTINGETATGNGQYLTGAVGSSNTEGLQILYTGTATGLVGSISFRKGISALTNALLTSYTDTVNGLLTGNDQAIQAQIDSLGTDIEDLEERLTIREQSLRQRFAAMERTIAQLQAQQARLGSITNLGGN